MPKQLVSPSSFPWTSTGGPNHACMGVAVRVADFGRGGAAPPPLGDGGAAPRTARAARKFGGLTGPEASFMSEKTAAPIFCNPTRQTELIVGCRFVFGVYLRREHAQKACPSVFFFPHAIPSSGIVRRSSRLLGMRFVRSASRRDLHTWRS